MARGQGEQGIAQKARFAAFISYSHADAAVAAKLQRKLERYRLPKHVVATQALDNAGLGQIFRDREDLAAAASLSDAIRAAIADAEALIVICSPDAKASTWVSAEIVLFRELHPDRPVLAALVRGEPAEAFPAALTENGREPLAADLRPGGDGGSLGFLKIVAGIAGVPLDTLIQRDAQRRVQRVMWITGAALTAMLAMGIMTTLAIQARNEAARQRASAEGLVEYMLTDLRTKLKGVGRIEVMEGVNKRAMAHYQGQGDLSSLPADSLERRARVLHAMGEDDEKKGNLPVALAQFREAHRTTQALLAKEPENPDRIFAHGQSEYWVGRAAWAVKNRNAAQAAWQGYLEQAQKLLSHDPDKARANLEMGYALGNLCELFLSDNFDVPKSIDYCRQSIRSIKTALKEAPDNIEIRLALANRYGWLAHTLKASKAVSEALSARREEQQILDSLAANDPKNFELQVRQMAPRFGAALLLIDEGRDAEGAKQMAVVRQACMAILQNAADNMEVRKYCARASYMEAKALAAIDRNGSKAALSLTRKLVSDLSKSPSERPGLAAYIKGMDEIERQLTGGEK